MKQTGMLVVSLRGVNFGFWSCLGCCGHSANILSRQDTDNYTRRETEFKFSFSFIYLFLCGVFYGQNLLKPRPDVLLQGLNSKFPTSIPVCSIWNWAKHLLTYWEVPLTLYDTRELTVPSAVRITTKSLFLLDNLKKERYGLMLLCFITCVIQA